jgi:hypothetical protein
MISVTVLYFIVFLLSTPYYNISALICIIYVFAVGKKDITRLLDKGIINKQEADKLPFLIMVTDYTRTQLVTAYYASQKTFKKKTKQRVFI